MNLGSSRRSKLKKAAGYGTLLFLLLLMGTGVFWYYESSVRYTDMTFYTWITNPTNESIIQTSIGIYAYSNLPVNFTGTSPTGANATFNIWHGGQTITADIGVIHAGQTIFIEDSGIPIHFPLESSHFNQSFPAYVSGYNSKLKVSYMSRIFANTAFGSIPIESTYTFPTDGTDDYFARIFTTDYALVAFNCVALLGFGALLHKRGHKTRGFPFITIGIVCVSAALYAFVGSGPEMNLLPGSPLVWNPATAWLFHGYFQHITGNLPYFIISSSVLEYWISKGTRSKRYLWYVLPLAGVIVPAVQGLPQSQYGYGLSTLIELQTFALWTYAIANWKKLIVNGRNVGLLLIVGLSMGVWFGWLQTLILQVPFNVYNSPFDLSEAQGHVFVGAIGLGGSLAYLSRRRLDEGLRWLRSKLGRAGNTKVVALNQ